MPEQIKSKPKSLVSNSFWSISLTIWQIAVTFFLTPFLVKELGLEYYGILILLLSISGVMGILNFGLGDTTLRYVAYYYGKDDTQSINRIISNTFSIFTIISIISFCILFFFSENIVNLLINDINENKTLFIDLVQITAVTIAISFMGGAFGTVPQAFQRYDISTKINIINSILYVVGTLVILFNHGSVKELVLWNLINTIILQVMNMFVSKKLISTLSFLPKFDKKTFREVFGFSFFTFLTQVLAQVRSNTDRFLTTSLIGLSAFSYLSIPQQLSLKGTSLIDSLGKVLMPKFSSINDENERKELFLSSSWYLLLISSSIFLPLTILIPDFLTLWISREFSDKSSFVSQIIMSSFIINGSFTSSTYLFNAMGKAYLITIIYVITTILILLINYFCITQFGFQGLGYAFYSITFVGIIFHIYCWFFVMKEKSIKPILITYIIPSLSILLLLYLLINFFNFNITTWISFIIYSALILLINIILLFAIDSILNKNINKFNDVISLLKRIKK